MTKEEIKAIVAAKIAGQGSMVDIGGALPQIINAIVDIIPEVYQLPKASAETLGGIKVGSNLSITEDGVLSAQGGGGVTPLIVEGQFDDMDRIFTPLDGQPSLSDAVSAFASGRPVILKFEQDGRYMYLQAISCDTEPASMTIIAGTTSNIEIVWSV